MRVKIELEKKGNKQIQQTPKLHERQYTEGND